jgi:hypothetical protein
MGIVSFKMWEDAAANSSGGGGVDGIGIGAKGEPPGKLKNPLNKKKKKMAEKKKGIWDAIRKRRAEGKPKKKPGDKGYPKTLKGHEKKESSGSHFKPGSRGAPDDWEARSNLSRNVRRDFWKSFKGKHTK